MKASSLIFFSFLVLFGCDQKSPPIDNATTLSNNAPVINSSSQSKIPKVTGIGGIFFHSDDPEKTKEWYGENLGLAIDDYGSVFEFRNAKRPDEINYLRWSTVAKGSDFFEPSESGFMVNYRVQNLDQLNVNLRESGVTILDSMITVEYGKFIHILDPDGNKIELWEPVDSVLTAFGGETTK